MLKPGYYNYNELRQDVLKNPDSDNVEMVKMILEKMKREDHVRVFPNLTFQINHTSERFLANGYDKCCVTEGKTDDDGRHVHFYQNRHCYHGHVDLSLDHLILIRDTINDYLERIGIQPSSEQLVLETTQKIRPIFTAEEVRNTYFDKYSKGADDTYHTFIQAFDTFRSENIYAKEVTNAFGTVMHVGDMSDPSNHPQWFMTKEEWVKLKTKPDDVGVVDDIAWTQIVSTCEHFQSTCKAESIKMDIADQLEIYLTQSDAESVIKDYCDKYIKIIPGGGRCIQGCNELVYEVYNKNTDKCWLMTRAEWNKL